MGESEFREKLLALLERMVKALESKEPQETPENGSGGVGRKS